MFFEPGSPDRTPDECRHTCCPLSRVRNGMAVRIKRLPDAPDVTTRLREIGFCEEQVIRLIARQATYICQVCNSRLAISAQLAEGILVEPLTSLGR